MSATEAFMNQLLNDPPFNKTMSVGARKLRNNVYELCFSHGLPHGKTDREEFMAKLQESYSRINWEKAIFWNHEDRIFEGVLRRTSRKYKDEEDKKSAVWERGTIAKNAPRLKNIDWLELAKFNNDTFWHLMVKFPREKLFLYPDSIDRIEPAFTNMYEMITDWLITDFNFTTLYEIWEFARDDSIDLIKSCMDMVEDISKRNTKYLKAIVNQHREIQKQEIQAEDSLNEHSKQILTKMIEIAQNREVINWEQIEEDSRLEIENDREFKKVKLS